MKWKPEYATGIHNIDQQHQEIVEIISLYERLSDDEASWHEVPPLIRRTRAFMEFHISVEEALMRLLPYPDYAAHRAEHQRELQHIAEIERRMSCGNLDHSLPLLMRHHLLGHIVVGDKLLAQYALSLFCQHASGKSKGGASTSRRRAATISPND